MGPRREKGAAKADMLAPEKGNTDTGVDLYVIVVCVRVRKSVPRIEPEQCIGVWKFARKL